MIHTENETYSLIYIKSSQYKINKIVNYIPTSWHVEDENQLIVWQIKGRLTPKHTKELRDKFDLIVIVN